MNRAAAQAFGSEIGALPDLLKDAAGLWAERLLERHPGALECLHGETRASLVRLVAASEFAGNTLLREWAWFAGVLAMPEAPPDLRFPPPESTAGVPDADDLKRRLRRFRNRRLLHILWRESRGYADTNDTLDALSTLADGLIAASVAAAAAELQERSGRVLDAGGREQPLVVLAMGKLGGRELNFSSDVDLIFLFPDDGESDGARALGAQEYFARLSRRVVALLDEVTADGFVYRVDTRLRPFGDSGPPVVSFGAFESYLLRHGRGWERYAYVKGRVIDTGAGSGAARELMEDIVQPFVYRRYLDYGVFESLREIKALIAAEARKRGLATNIKLGRGGIREIEFVAQSLQLVRGGREHGLRTTGLRTALRRLAETRGISARAASELEAAWLFLRRLENGLQAIRDQQTHDLPRGAADRARLALAMDFDDWEALSGEVERRRRIVSDHFTAVAFRGAEPASGSELFDGLSGLWAATAGAGEWQAALEGLGFRQVPELAAILVRFAESSAVGQMGRTGARRLARFMPDVLAALRGSERPAVVLERVLSVVERILRRSAYVALLNENPAVRDRLVALCERSAWLAEEIGRYPLLLDELLDPRLKAPTREEAELELARRLDGLAADDGERQIEALAQFQRATLFRIAVADVTGDLAVMKVSDRLTELAEVVLQRVLAIAWSDLTRKHGRPRFRAAHGRRHAGFGVIAYGKFAGMELSYRSDLDLVFLHDSTGEAEETDGERPLENAAFFTRLVRRIVHLLNTQTGSGALYQVDTRLRPSGRSGLLVTNIEAFERYQEENAWTWEHQALLRSRPVAGSAVLAREFERVRSETLRHRVRRDRLRNDVMAMRRKMRQRLDRSDGERFDLKQGQGGIADIEFIVQYLALENAARHPAVIHYPDNIRQLGTLGAAGCLAVPQVSRLQEIYRAYRRRLHHLALDERPPLAGADEFTRERDFVAGLWREMLGEPPP